MWLRNFIHNDIFSLNRSDLTAACQPIIQSIRLVARKGRQSRFYFEGFQRKCLIPCLSALVPTSVPPSHFWRWLPVPPVTGQGVSVSAALQSRWGSAVRSKMRLLPVLVTVLLTVTLAYYVYIPLPDAIQEPWKLMLLDSGFRTTMHLVRGERMCFSFRGFKSGAFMDRSRCASAFAIRIRSAQNMHALLCAIL